MKNIFTKTLGMYIIGFALMGGFAYGASQVVQVFSQKSEAAHLPSAIAVSNIVRATTTAEPLVTAYVTPVDAVYSVSGFVNITATTVGVITLKCDYTDINGNAHTFNLVSLTGQVSNVGTYNFNDITLNAQQGSTVTIYTTVAGASGLTYDVGGIIQGI